MPIPNFNLQGMDNNTKLAFQAIKTYLDTLSISDVNNLNTQINNLNTQILIMQNSYSTSEKFTGEYWIDGRPIYQKVINFGALPNGTTTDR